MPIDPVFGLLRCGGVYARVALICGLSVGPAAAVLAQELDCEAAMTQSEMNACAAQEFALADADLNEAYAAARRALRAVDADLPSDLRGGEVALRDAQRAWITFRDKACAAEGFQMRGGSAEPLLVYGCKARLTDQRAEALWDLAAGFDG